ncbi:Vacuolar protein sorting-associated protein 26 [Diplonema papillatum]|nr:Vacuolar protein sorting-associated protein 26 [Diplonema papillatum]
MRVRSDRDFGQPRTVCVRPHKGYVIDHEGISISYVGELIADEGLVPKVEIFSLSRCELSPPKVIQSSEKLDFAFESLKSPYDSYKGTRLKVRYYFRLRIKRRRTFDVVYPEEVWIRCQEPQLQQSLCPSLFLCKTESDASLWAKPYHVYRSADEKQPPGGEPPLQSSFALLAKKPAHAPAAPDTRPPAAQHVGNGQSAGEQHPPEPGDPTALFTNHDLTTSSPNSALNSNEPPAGQPEQGKPPPNGSNQTPKPDAAKLQNIHPAPAAKLAVVEKPIELRIVLEDRLQLSLCFEKNVYHTKDVIKGRMRFDKIEAFDFVVAKLQILRREIYCGRTLASDTFFTSELIDGLPKCKEDIPLSLPLRGITSLTPSCTGIIGKASVRFYLRLMLYDNGPLPFTAETEVYIWRQADEACQPN